MASDNVSERRKTCTGCRATLPATLENFPPHPPGKYGVHSRCRPCKKIDDAERRARPDQLARQQAWRDANKAYVKKYNDEYRVSHPSTPYVAAWRAKNIEAVREQERIKRRRHRGCVDKRLMHRLSQRLRATILDKAGRQTAEILGFSSQDLRRHIERQFTAGMTWADVLEARIHIDHIIPVSAFRIRSVDDPDFKLCWGLANLRPMWALDNMAKGSRRTMLL